MICGIEELLDQRAEGIGLRQAGNLISERKAFEDFLNGGREAIEIILEIWRSCCWLARPLRSRSVYFEVS